MTNPQHFKNVDKIVHISRKLGCLSLIVTITFQISLSFLIEFILKILFYFLLFPLVLLFAFFNLELSLSHQFSSNGD